MELTRSWRDSAGSLAPPAGSPEGAVARGRRGSGVIGGGRGASVRDWRLPRSALERGFCRGAVAPALRRPGRRGPGARLPPWRAGCSSEAGLGGGAVPRCAGRGAPLLICVAAGPACAWPLRALSCEQRPRRGLAGRTEVASGAARAPPPCSCPCGCQGHCGEAPGGLLVGQWRSGSWLTPCCSWP